MALSGTSSQTKVEHEQVREDVNQELAVMLYTGIDQDDILSFERIRANSGE
jgi:hypothetical protein